MKNRIAALSLTLVLSVGLCAPAHAAETSFSDVPADHWAASSIEQMAERGVIAGVGNGLFAPEKTISNAEFIAMLAREFFPDHIVEGGENWYDPYIKAAKTVRYTSDGVGILQWTTVGEDISLVEAPINRYDMAQIIFWVMNSTEIIPKVLDRQNEETEQFLNSGVGWETGYLDAVRVCYAYGILSGVDSKGTFNGEGVMTRAQAAVVMDRLCQYKAEVMSNIPTVALDLPEGALMISSRAQFTGGTADGVVDGLGCLYLNPNSVMYGCSIIGVITKGYSTVTLTFTAADKDTLLTASARLLGNSIWDPYETREVYVVPAGETQTLTFDCSGTEGLGIRIERDDAIGNFAEGWITNMYLLP